MRCQRGRGLEEEEYGAGCPLPEGCPVSPPHPTRRSGERRELPHRGPGRAPAQNEFGAFWRLQEAAGGKDSHNFVL